MNNQPHIHFLLISNNVFFVAFIDEEKPVYLGSVFFLIAMRKKIKKNISHREKKCTNIFNSLLLYCLKQIDWESLKPCEKYWIYSIHRLYL